MILRILILFFIIALLAFILYFIFAIFAPAIKSQTVKNSNPLFSDCEINCENHSSNNKKVLVTDKKAFVLCNPTRVFKNERLDYNSVKSCKLFSSIYETATDCSYGCVGFGDCVKVCPQEAIVIKNNTAVVTSSCCGCGKCVVECPKGLIKLFSKEELSSISDGENSYKLKLCSASSTCLTTCTRFNSENKMQISHTKDFKFWQTCYKILLRKN